ncbi:MAG: OsmC family peroxiredoxin [Gemmatimonadetes bacterium]|nr:MAG: OsmC family peroxiredoxin [Gemmatimonadota bacterium]
MSSSDRKQVTLRWKGEGLLFEGGPDGVPSVTIDGDSHLGPSPMDTLLLALAGCMAADVRVILEKGRVPLAGLAVRVSGARAASPPRRYTSIRLVFEVDGPAPEHASKVERALALSRETYCSVLHTLDPDLEVAIELAGA